MTTEMTITNRTRNLGLGWTNDVEQTATGLAVKRVAAPDITGGLRSIEQELNRAAKINNSNDWRVALFVGGRRVLFSWGYYYTGCGKDADGFDKCCPLGSCDHYTDGWVSFSKTRLTEILNELREGQPVRVQTE